MKKLFLILFPLSLFAQDLPDAPGKANLQRICAACHDLGPVTSMTGSSDTWQSVIDDMKTKGADGTPAEFKEMIGYLSKYFGDPVKINSETAPNLEASLQITTAEAAAIVKYRTDNGAFKAWADLAKVPGLDMKKLDGLQKRIKFS